MAYGVTIYPLSLYNRQLYNHISYRSTMIKHYSHNCSREAVTRYKWNLLSSPDKYKDVTTYKSKSKTTVITTTTNYYDSSPATTRSPTKHQEETSVWGCLCDRTRDFSLLDNRQDRWTEKRGWVSLRLPRGVLFRSLPWAQVTPNGGLMCFRLAKHQPPIT